MSAHTHTSPENPNEARGVRACLAVGQQKHADCSGEWTTFLGVAVINPLAPIPTICAYHAGELFKTPTVTERKPKPRKPAAARARELEGLSL